VFDQEFFVICVNDRLLQSLTLFTKYHIWPCFAGKNCQ
jgi:hypothetical protein